MMTPAEDSVHANVSQLHNHRGVVALRVIAGAQQSLVDRSERPDLRLEYFASLLLRSVYEAIVAHADLARQTPLLHQNDGKVIAGADLEDVEVAEALDFLRLIRLQDVLEIAHPDKLSVLGDHQDAIRVGADLPDLEVRLNLIPWDVSVVDLLDVRLEHFAVIVNDVEERVAVRGIPHTLPQLYYVTLIRRFADKQVITLRQY